MTRYLRRRRPGRDENLKAAALGIGVGLAAAAGAFYLGRILLGREVLGSPDPGRIPRGERPGRISGRTRRTDGS